ncbi:hypothetical protein GE09DRAFT_510883 [Coniochaeta sp. 2T2.1]|nr:hypothetical protein GE09DRAFT_510883 [Coniochaeta sp. 2T2.1]
MSLTTWRLTILVGAVTDLAAGHFMAVESTAMTALISISLHLCRQPGDGTSSCFTVLRPWVERLADSWVRLAATYCPCRRLGTSRLSGTPSSRESGVHDTSSSLDMLHALALLPYSAHMPKPYLPALKLQSSCSCFCRVWQANTPDSQICRIITTPLSRRFTLTKESNVSRLILPLQLRVEG